MIAYLDGSTESDSGSADDTTSTDGEGFGDYSGDSDLGLLGSETPVDYTDSAMVNGSDQTDVNYFNLLGDNFETTMPSASGSGPRADSYTMYDSDNRPIDQVGADGSSTDTIYNPLTGAVAETIDVSNDGPSQITANQDFYTTAEHDGESFNVDRQITTADDGSEEIDDTSTDGLHTWDTVNGGTTETDTVLNGEGSETVTTINPDNSQTVQNYANGLLMSETDKGSNGTTTSSDTYTYNGLQEMTSDDSSAAGGTITYTYFPDGTVQTTTYPDGRFTKVEARDPVTGATTKFHNLDGSETDTTVNDKGQVTSQTGGNQAPESFYYSPDGTLTLTIVGSGGKTESISTPENLADGQTTGQSVNGQSTGDTYNTSGELTQTTSNGVTSNFTYDDNGNVNSTTYTTSTSSVPDPNSTLIYDITQRDADGDVLVDTQQANDGPSLTQSMSYNADDNLTGQTQPWVSGAGISYSYNSDSSDSAGAGALASSTLTTGSSGAQASLTTNYGYDQTTGLASTVTDSVGNVFTYHYNPATDQVSSITVGSVTTSFGYDSTTQNLTSQSTTGSTGSIYSGTYAYNSANQRTQDTTSQTQSDGTSSSSTLNYGYDALQQLTSVGGSESYTYSYDDLGNRTDLGSVNTLNQYGPTVATYNSQGDTTASDGFTFGYDALNRMVSATADNNSVKVTFSYDNQNRRTEKDVYTWSGSAWTLSSQLKFLYDGNNLMAQVNGLTGQVMQSFVWGPDGRLLAINDFTQGSTPVTYLADEDASGNVVSLTTLSGTVVATYTYDPFGNRLSATGDAAALAANPFGWQQKYTDQETGLLYSLNRYYNPVQGRWMTQDPTSTAGGTNVYVYSGNDPVNRSDYSGLGSAPGPGAPPGSQERLAEWQAVYPNDGWAAEQSWEAEYHASIQPPQPLPPPQSPLLLNLPAPTVPPRSGNALLPATTNLSPPPLHPDATGGYDVYVMIWNHDLPGVGHAMMIDAQLKYTLLSQFPNPHATKGVNVTVSTINSLMEEGRPPDYIFKVHIVNFAPFRNTINDHRTRPIWDWYPMNVNWNSDETNCVHAVADALNAGGIPVNKDYDWPGNLGADLESLSKEPPKPGQKWSVQSATYDDLFLQGDFPQHVADGSDSA